jgi:hypothetical protein
MQPQDVLEWLAGTALEEIRRRHVRMSRENRILSRNALIRASAVEIGTLAPGVEYWIAESPLSMEFAKMQEAERAGALPEGFCEHSFLGTLAGALNGYVAFPKRCAPLRSRGTDGVVAFIKVHGGVSYHFKDRCACVLGFDTGHLNSQYVPRTDKQWIAWQCRVLYEGILRAAEIEEQYLRAQTDEARERIVEPLVAMIPEEDPGFEAMMQMLATRLGMYAKVIR